MSHITRIILRNIERQPIRALASLAWALPAALQQGGPVLAEPRAAYVHRISLRRAGESELLLLPGIGVHRARRIAQARESAGPSASVEQILSAAGQPRGTWDDLAPWLEEDE